MRRFLVSFVAVAFFALAASPLMTQGQNQEPKAKFLRVEKKITNSYIVVLADDVESKNVRQMAGDLVSQYSGKIRHVYEAALKGFAVEMSEAEALLLSADPRVKYVEEDGEATGSDIQFSPRPGGSTASTSGTYP